MKSLGEVFDAATVSSLARSRVYGRGVAYFDDGRVEPAEVRSGRLEATVRGTVPYVVELWVDGGRPQWSCTCPAAEDGSFCKHAVAVALSIGAGDEPPAIAPSDQKGRSPSPGTGQGSVSGADDELAAFVGGLQPERLVEIVLDRAAVELFWQAFMSGPSLTAYRRLLDEDEGQDWLERCGDHLRNSLDRDPRAEAARRATPDAAFRVPPPAVPEAAAALVEILLYEGRMDEAWKAADDFGCRSQMWLTLARAREQGHPLDAMAVYEPVALAIIERKDAKQYQSAVDLIARHRLLADSAGVPERFAALLERARTEHRPKRKLQALLDVQGW